MSIIEDRYHACLALVRSRGQEHLLGWFDALDAEEQGELLGGIESIPWEVVDPLVDSHVLSSPKLDLPKTIEPADVWPQVPASKRRDSYDNARIRGRALLASGKVAAFTVAGGQGTRLGFDGPKGAMIVTPVGGQTLFELFASMILAASQRYEAPIPWYIMTSLANHQATIGFLREHNYFGLPEEDVMPFPQAMLPLFDFGGKILLENKSRVSLGPDGHGGSLKALVASGALDDMRRRGVETITYFQIDNPLVQPFDPLFLGLHASTESEMSTKVATKADDLERVGNLCMCDGKLAVIEYTELPDNLAHARNADGSRKLDAGNLAIHLFDVDFVDRVVGKSFQLPYRRAEKAVPFVDESGAVQRPSTPNAIKLETFVFDVVPLARNPLVLAVDRAEEFSPVKNASGTDSLETSQRDQIARACRWLESAGIDVPRRPNGTPDVVINISPSFALDAEELAEKAAQIDPLQPGESRFVT